MNSLKSVATFFGWCTIINFGLLIFASLSWMLVHEGVSQVGASMMGITAEQINVGFFNGLMVYRAEIFLLNVVPYIVLKIMGSGHASENL